MKDYQASVEKLRNDAAAAAVIRDLATDKIKHELYDLLHQHLNGLADEVERAMNSTLNAEGSTPAAELGLRKDL